MNESRTYHGLDALRGAAAISVVLNHLAGAAPWLARSGYLAVDLFFVMSGFVVANAYEAKIWQSGAFAFLRVRIIRFLPLFYLGGALGVLRLILLAFHGTADAGIPDAVAYFLFLPSPSTSISAINPPGWSLLLEIYVNAAYALLLPRLSNRWLTVIVALAGAGLIFVWAIGGTVTGGPNWPDLHLGILRILFAFSLGVLAFRRADLLRFGSASPWLVLVLLAAALSVPSFPAWDLAFMLIGSPVIFLLGLQCGRETWIARYGAASSYCVYVIHWPILQMAIGTASVLHIAPLIFAIPAMLGVLTFAPMIDRSFDRPARRWLSRWNTSKFSPSPKPSSDGPPG